MRLFVAIYFSKEIEEELTKIQTKLSQIGVKPNKNIHMTLKFLGEVEENDIEKIKVSLSKIKFTKFKIKLTNLSYFSPKQIRIVYCDVETNNCLNELANEIDKATAHIKSQTKFKSHITINRVKNLKNKKEFIDKLRDIKVPSLNCDIDGFCLVKSDLKHRESTSLKTSSYELESGFATVLKDGRVSEANKPPVSDRWSLPSLTKEGPEYEILEKFCAQRAQ